MSDNSDTPRTDAVAVDITPKVAYELCEDWEYAVDIEFSRTLEREIAQLREQLDEANNVIELANKTYKLTAKDVELAEQIEELRQENEKLQAERDSLQKLTGEAFKQLAELLENRNNDYAMVGAACAILMQNGFTNASVEIAEKAKEIFARFTDAESRAEVECAERAE